MLKSIRNISILLSFCIICFGAGNITALRSVEQTIAKDRVRMFDVTRELTQSETLLSCLTRKFAFVNGVAITCSVVKPTDKNTQEPPTAIKKPKYYSA